ncbi:cyanate hydratase [Kwoniella bestiolae CBS 10118]|uniref:Cyanate hydratase n=1 Tax=Kwoniella bestiolae CBS 10118 TaxID=1296100 RepID=A0A1B9G6A3_9TREE|nr:cyanate hydratase [Kwoniella bestiolae CBS 10118]OCF26533.1 cyanate hydratase [Kwoniella bestiolae CBS 10118]
MHNLPPHCSALLLAKTLSGLTFAEIATKIDKPEVWLASLFYGQAVTDETTAQKIYEVLGEDSFVDKYNEDYLAPNTAKLTKQKLINGLIGGGESSFGVKGMVDREKGLEMPPKDPVLYRLYEVLLVYGYSYKAIIQEKFGDGIMSAIDFRTSVERKKDPKGDRVVITMDGKFLSYSDPEAWKG